MRKLKNNKTQTMNAKHRRKRVPFIQNQVIAIRQDDNQYQLLCEDIVQKLDHHRFTRHTKIRLQAWLERLNRAQYNSTWRQNRNNYLKLLDLMIHCQAVCYPFTAFPAREELSVLQKHDIDQIVNEIERTVKQDKHHTRKQSCKYSRIHSNEQREYQMDHTTTTKSLKKIPIKEETESERKTISISKLLMKRLSSNGKRVETLNSQGSKNLTQDCPLKERKSLINYETQKNYTKSCNDNFKVKSGKKSLKGAISLNDVINFQERSCLISQKIRTFAQNYKPNGILSNNQTKPTKALKICSQLHKKKSEQALNKVKSSSTNFGVQKDFSKNREYWQSNSLAQIGTPRYLNFYPSHPYVSLALSETEQILITTRSKDYNCCECFTSFISRIETDHCIQQIDG